jgi:hypothetical protein
MFSKSRPWPDRPSEVGIQMAVRAAKMALNPKSLVRSNLTLATHLWCSKRALCVCRRVVNRLRVVWSAGDVRVTRLRPKRHVTTLPWKVLLPAKSAFCPPFKDRKPDEAANRPRCCPYHLQRVKIVSAYLTVVQSVGEGTLASLWLSWVLPYFSVLLKF